MNADNILFRCSSLGHIMTEGKQITEKQLEMIKGLEGKEKLTDKQKAALAALIYKRDNPELPDGCKTHLIDVFISAQYHRNTEIESKFLKKGNAAEEDSITLYSLAKKQFLKKNEERLTNDFISGTPDLFRGTSIRLATEIIDTKTSWDVFTFFRAVYKDVADQYYWQGQGYMALSGAKKHTVAYCLVNTPWHLVQNELYRESFKHPDNNTPAAIELNIIANMVYDRKTFFEYVNFRGLVPQIEVEKSIVDGFIEIPREERMHEFMIERNDADIEKIYERVKKCREYMNEYLFKVRKSELENSI